MDKELNLALLIDFENIAAGASKEGLGRVDVHAIVDRFKEKGRILVARSYADWGRFAKFKQDCLMAGINLFELTSHGMQDKNRADVALVVDCMELAYTKPYVDAFVIVSGDSDFTPLVLKLKELDKRVIGCGTRKSTSRLIIESCDEFIFYDSLARSKRTSKPRTKSGSISRTEAFELVMGVLEALQRESDGPVPGSRLKQTLKRKEPDFNEGDLGYASFTRFLEAFRDRGGIRLSKADRGGGVFVESTAIAVDEKPPEPIHRLIGEPALLYAKLSEAGAEPLTPDLRTTVLTSFVEVVNERTAKHAKCTVRFVPQDVFKRVMAAHPALSVKHVRAVVDSLRAAGALLHTKGGPVQSATASFVISEDVEQLNRRLNHHYLTTVKELELDPSVAALAELLFGDKTAHDAVAELVKAAATPLRAPAMPELPPEPEGADDGAKGRRRKPRRKDSDDEASVEAAAAAPAEDAAPKKKRAPRKKKVAKQVAAESEDAAPAAEAAPATEAPSGDAGATDAAPTDAAEAAPAEAEPAKPVKKRAPRRRTVKKAVEAPVDAS